MAYLIMDDCLGRMFDVQVSYNTSVVAMAGGGEERVAHWASALRKWQFGTRDQTVAHMLELEVFFHEVLGRYTPFLFKQLTEFAVTNGAIGTGDGVETVYPFAKVYGATFPRTRTGLYPKSGTVSVKLNAVTVDPADYTVDYDTGIVTFDAAPGNAVVITATFEFYSLVRFDSDSLGSTIVDRQRRFARASVGLEEVKA